MPKFSPTDSRHPVNRARLLHAAVLEVVRPGTLVPPDKWRRCVMLATGVLNRENAHRYTQMMEDLGMVELKPKEGVTVLPPDYVQLPL